MYLFSKILKILSKITLLFLAFLVVLFIYFNIPISKTNDDSKLGVTFSARYARDIGLDPQETLVAVMDELNVRRIRIPVYWDEVEKEVGIFDFSSVDWQLEEARKRNAEIILVVGQKVPRWPECYVPEWAKNDDALRRERLLAFIRETVLRYKGRSEIKFWQVENEPFLRFGICPSFDADLLDQEISLVRNLDSQKKIIVTDSGELSLWVGAAKRADIFGTTLYRTIWKKEIGYFDYPIGPRFFQFKYWLIGLFANQKNAIVIELQGEPWISGWTTEGTLEEQFKSMNPEKLKDNVIYARKVGFPEIYIWGVEWWYWLKVKENHPEMWETAKILFLEKK